MVRERPLCGECEQRRTSTEARFFAAGPPQNDIWVERGEEWAPTSARVREGKKAGLKPTPTGFL